MTKLGASRITCGACGFCREISAEEGNSYELWYTTEFRGHRLWAFNREHLAFLIAWFSGAIKKADLGAGGRGMVETLPKWMILAKHRDDLLKAFHQMSVKSACNPDHA